MNGHIVQWPRPRQQWHRLRGREGELRSGHRGPAAWLRASWPAVGLGRGLGLCEQLVHDFGAGGDDGSEFAAVDDFCGAGGGVPDEAGDFLDADAAVFERDAVFAASAPGY
jgi:hypothetical protein